MGSHNIAITEDEFSFDRKRERHTNTLKKASLKWQFINRKKIIICQWQKNVKDEEQSEKYKKTSLQQIWPLVTRSEMNFV